ncbi:AAA family ATPase [bacterium]|nr:AAA family ATPase [bacterium]
MKYIYCPTCNGRGRLINEKKCPKCQGRGFYALIGGFLIYFEESFYPGQKIIHGLKKFFRILINSALFGFGLLGIISILKVLLHLDFLSHYWQFFFLPPRKLKLIFWISILTDCFLYYRLISFSEKKKIIWPQTKGEITSQAIDWSDISRLPNRFKINVIDALSPKAFTLILNSWNLAKKLKHKEILPIHLFSAGLNLSGFALIINRLGISWIKLKSKITQALSLLPTGEETNFSIETKQVLFRAYEIAAEKKAKNISLTEIFQSISEQKNMVTEILYDLEITGTEVKNVCVWIDVYKKIKERWQKFRGAAQLRPKGAMNKAMTAIATPYLDAYSQDLTQIARGGYLPICLDRKKEFAEIFRIIEGGQQSLILVGQPGVGKTSIINGLAWKMIEENVPKYLQDKRLVSLSVPSLVAGASRPGEIEERLQIIMNEIVRAGNIILFIPKIHNMVGVKTTKGELDISEMLADALKRKLFLVIATTFPKEYRENIETKSLGQVLTKVEIDEPEENATIQILEANTAYIEAKQQVYFSYGAIRKAYKLSKQFIHERFLPEKAINLLKEVASAVHRKRGRRTIIHAEDVAEIVSEKTGIPVTKVTEKESEKLLNLESRIHQRIIDQNEAVNMVSAALRRARTELRDVKRPIVNLLFLGPTGVGKTELAKTVAEVYFGNENKMIRLDMSEYQTKESINRLIGTPGSEKGGQLTEAVRLNPFSLVLLDEIEKAHPDILNLFLQVMDDGRLTDALGRTIDFTNVILIGTSNAGTQFIQDEIRKGTSIKTIQDILIREKLKPYFRPEFLNRFDGIIVFKPLGKNEIREITKLLLNKIIKKLANKGITLKITEEAINELAEAGFDPTFGARPLRRVIQERVNDAISKYLLTGKIERKDIVILDKNGTIRIKKGQGLNL